jgi:hypothetical protein
MHISLMIYNLCNVEMMNVWFIFIFRLHSPHGPHGTWSRIGMKEATRSLRVRKVDVAKAGIGTNAIPIPIPFLSRSPFTDIDH